MIGLAILRAATLGVLFLASVILYTAHMNGWHGLFTLAWLVLFGSAVARLRHDLIARDKTRKGQDS